QDIVRRALAKDPSVRINSVQEMVALLPDGGGPTAPTPPPVFTQAKTQTAQPDYEYTAQGTISDANQVARDGCTKASAMIREANRRAASAVAPADGSDEEPIWKAIRERFDGNAWGNLHPLAKAVLVFAIVGLVVWYPDSIFELMIPLFVVYWIYYAV